MIIATETFIATPEDQKSEYGRESGWNEGTIEVTFQNKTRRVRCVAPREGRNEWIVSGLCARYSTGTKVWHATIWWNPEKKVAHVSTGFDNRSGRYSQPKLVGFIEDVQPNFVSKR